MTRYSLPIVSAALCAAFALWGVSPASAQDALPPPAAPPTPPTPPVSMVTPENARVLERLMTVLQDEKTHEDLGAALKLYSRALQGQATVLQNVFYPGKSSALTRKKVAIDVRNVPARDAIVKLLETAKVDFVVDEDFPTGAKISLAAKDILLSTALDLTTQAAGVGWSEETRDGKTVVRVGKNVSPFHVLFYPTVSKAVPGALLPPGITFQTPSVYSYRTTEHRSTFTCPHCKRKVTLVQPGKSRVSFPFPSSRAPLGRGQDDAPNPPAAKTPDTTTPKTDKTTLLPDWQFCPFCGKPVGQAAGGLGLWGDDSQSDAFGDVPLTFHRLG